jgi:ubiquinone biosynthesis protein
VTLVVIGSYSWTRFVGTFRGEEYVAKKLTKKHALNARRIQRAIIRLQGLFIKVGQLFSVMTNFLPEEFRRELEGLQDSLPPRSYEVIRKRFVDDFGREPNEVFAEFSQTALAAASISQVHLAKLSSGEQVAVKVQYPDIDRMVRSDLRTFRRILRIIGFFMPAHGLDVVYEEVSKMLHAELDFSAEARNVQRIAANFGDSRKGTLGFPEVLPEYSTRRILTTRYIDGIKVSDVAQLTAAGHDTGEIARKIVDLYCEQIFVHGFYHADPHPGNVLVGETGQINLLDFGAVASIRPEMREGIAHFLQAVLNQNTERIALALREMGFIARTDNDEVFDRVVMYFHEQFQQSVKVESFNLEGIKIDPDKALEHLLALRQMDIGIGELSSVFQVPKDWILLERTVLLLTGLCTLLDPTIRPIELIRPYLRDFVLGEDGEWSTFLLDSGKELLVQYAGLPGDIRKFLSKASTGRVEMRIRNMAEGHQKLYALGHQLILTIIGATGVSLATWLHLSGEYGLRDVAIGVASGSGVLLLLSMWRQTRRR